MPKYLLRMPLGCLDPATLPSALALADVNDALDTLLASAAKETVRRAHAARVAALAFDNAVANVADGTAYRPFFYPTRAGWSVTQAALPSGSYVPGSRP